MLKCIVAGLGGRGRHWVSEIKQRDDCEVVAGVEPMAANRKKAMDEQGLAVEILFNSLDEAIENCEADFVLDVTPPSVHREVAEKAFAAGLHVIGEKPLSDDFAVAKSMMEAGKSAGLTHMITQNYRFTAFPRTTRKLLQQGIIGRPEQCDVQFYMPWADIPGSHYVTQPYMLINDMMIHHFDLIRYVLQVNPVSVQAITWNHSWGWHQGDAAHVIYFEFPDNLHATHVSCGCAVGSKTSWNGNWRIEGPKGTIEWGKEKMVRSHLHRTDASVEEEITPLDVPAPGKAILDEFLAAIEEDREPECSAEDNLNSLRMVFAAIRSAKEGRRVELEEIG
ncbi:MAG: hypothetical protein AUJ92_00750 [Armatimonadetes bacterium CG2_30_59_28]|nr:Gfo/Idh/MocA family oxidoreductase [Armatimonadota bacterium]OIO98797.1 MAG: hypothetical protein AUJ92_00750 [Armatimonadetes bacterium CG2_30_59_28]PIU60615.1 MAG: hypothetical protein COS85_23570 [Armatimonadetes bacterium CG07_land_8_20_14_0_80_59_28]PIX44772.1 MAG: hypothetical protein COZ56_03735 [Armatimonadetes bacterium CG_4_8_14_3_um_filter_58_9]PIY38104.1 MAG: hypothetical protein COZ05_21360 [Armatimonadetes bacterium CG_4_10_14_3_um_filter_59_10]